MFRGPKKIKKKMLPPLQPARRRFRGILNKILSNAQHGNEAVNKTVTYL